MSPASFRLLLSRPTLAIFLILTAISPPLPAQDPITSENSARILAHYVAFNSFSLDFLILEVYPDLGDGWALVEGLDSDGDFIDLYFNINNTPYFYYIADYGEEIGSLSGWDYIFPVGEETYIFTFDDLEPPGYWTWTDGEQVAELP